jgi:4-hydroxy-2-oxoheptanedioate aldolase
MTRGAVLKQRLKDGRPIYGLIHGLANPAVAELAALAGYDIVIVDDEHGAGDRPVHMAIAQAVAAGGAACFMRLASHDPLAIGQALDLGMDGLMIPGVHNAAQAAAVVRACRYPPLGRRGYGLSVARASGYGLFARRYGDSAADLLFLTAMIESAQGVAEASEIARVDGIDAVIVGVQDLAADLGVPSDVAHPVVQQALAQVEAAVLAAGKTIGTVVHAGVTVHQLIERGHRFITLGADTRLLGAAMHQQLEGCPQRMPSHSVNRP